VATILGGADARPSSPSSPSQPPLSPSPSHAAPPTSGPVALSRRCTACETRYPADFLVCPRDATPLVDESGAADVDPLIGRLLGETYQIVRILAEGGMGRIYEARHLRLKERRFAVKTLHADLAKNQEVVSRFMREAESASSLSHPNVVDVFDVHHLSDGTPYFVSELLEGEELADYVTARGPIEPRLAVAMVRQVCLALKVAHARGIVHRDMKPENIFVLRPAEDDPPNKVPTVKILDFGISKSAERTDLTRTGVIMGTPSYMAPEQARGLDVDHRADVYAVGAVLYHAITGRRPFDADDPTATLSMVLTQDPVRPRDIDARIPESVELIVQRAMSKEPADRYPTMAELERALAVLDDPSRGGAGLVVPTATPFELPSSAALRALTVAKGVLAGPTPPPAQAAALARLARPTVVVASSALGLWLVGSATAALGGLVRVLHEGEITLTESVLLVVGCLFAAATPTALYVMHVKKVIWPNSVRALQLATDLRRTCGAALLTYGAFSVLARVGHTVLFRQSTGLASGVWDILLFLVSVLSAATIGGLGPLLRNLRRRRRS